MKRLLASSFAVALFAAAGAVSAQALNIAFANPLSSLDPQLNNHAGDRSVDVHFWDLLVENKWNKLQSGLALLWKTLDPKTWEFKLRPNMKWHDGQSFTANDVVFSYQRACSVSGSVATFAGCLRTMKSVTTENPLTLIIKTTILSPGLPLNLASAHIVSKHVGERSSTEDYNAGRAVVGTGPYEFVSYVPGDRVVMAHNDNYWGDKQLWEKVNYCYINNAAARTTNLLSGEVDVIDKVSVSDLARLRQSPNVKVFAYPGLRVMLLQPSFRKGPNDYITGNDGKPLPNNPLLDVRVRRALSLAIDREAIVDRILQGAATAANQWMPPDTYGYNPDVKDITCDPAQAKKLLADAGSPQGFNLVIHAPNGRYPQGPGTAQAVAQFWTRIDVKAHVEVMSWSVYSGRANKNEYAMNMLVWGNGTGEANYALVNVLAAVDTKKGLGASNWGHYSNAAVDDAPSASTEEFNVEKRATTLRHSVKLVSDDVGVMPLYHYRNVWAAKKGLKVTPMTSDRTAAQVVTKDGK